MDTKKRTVIQHLLLTAKRLTSGSVTVHEANLLHENQADGDESIEIDIQIHDKDHE